MVSQYKSYKRNKQECLQFITWPTISARFSHAIQQLILHNTNLNNELKHNNSN